MPSKLVKEIQDFVFTWASIHIKNVGPFNCVDWLVCDQYMYEFFFWVYMYESLNFSIEESSRRTISKAYIEGGCVLVIKRLFFKI